MWWSNSMTHSARVSQSDVFIFIFDVHTSSEVTKYYCWKSSLWSLEDISQQKKQKYQGRYDIFLDKKSLLEICFQGLHSIHLQQSKQILRYLEKNYFICSAFYIICIVYTYIAPIQKFMGQWKGSSSILIPTSWIYDQIFN